MGGMGFASGGSCLSLEQSPGWTGRWRKGTFMPLSEHEQRLLEQMEKALYAEDPKFATSLRSSRGRASRGRAALGVLALLAGLGMLLGGVATTIIALGVVGFVAMLIGCVIIYSAFQNRTEVATDETTGGVPGAAPGGGTSGGGMPGGGTSGGGTSGGGSSGGSGFMDRMEDRWRRRSEDGQQ